MTSYNFLKLPKYITARYWFVKPTFNLYVYLLSQATYLEKTKINNIVLNKHQILTSSKALESALKKLTLYDFKMRIQQEINKINTQNAIAYAIGYAKHIVYMFICLLFNF